MMFRLVLVVGIVAAASTCLAGEYDSADDASYADVDLGTAGLEYQQYHSMAGPAGLPGGAECCEFPFNCCQNAWDGYCAEKRCCPRCGHLEGGPLCWISCFKHRHRCHARSLRSNCCPDQCGHADVCQQAGHCHSGKCQHAGHYNGEVVEMIVTDELIMPTPPARPSEPRSYHTSHGRSAPRQAAKGSNRYPSRQASHRH